MYRAYKFRLYPTDEQKNYINKNFGCSRFIFNHYLNNIKTTGYKNPTTNIKDYTTKLKYDYPFLQEADNNTLIKTIFRLDDAIKRCHIGSNINPTTNSVNQTFPKYKSKFSKNSYTITQGYGSYIKINLTQKTINLPQLQQVKIRGYKKLTIIPGKIKNATISKEPNGKYYISILYQQTDTPTQPIKPSSIIGIDLGIKTLLTLSDGTTFDNSKAIEKYEKRIKRCQKELSKKQKGSKNYYKCKEKLAKLYSRLANARKYYIHKITKQITDTYDLIVCESLQTKQMIMQKQLSKQLTDASFSEILRQLEYKAKWKNKHFYQINQYFPSSQTCSVCNKIDKKYKNLNEREYICTNCHTKLDRDYNASVNIMFEGLKLFMKNNRNLA